MKHSTQKNKLNLTPADFAILNGIVKADPGGLIAHRAQMVILSGQGLTDVEVADRLRTGKNVVAKWRNRFVTQPHLSFEERLSYHSLKLKEKTPATLNQRLRTTPELQSNVTYAKAAPQQQSTKTQQATTEHADYNSGSERSKSPVGPVLYDKRANKRVNTVPTTFSHLKGEQEQSHFKD